VNRPAKWARQGKSEQEVPAVRSRSIKSLVGVVSVAVFLAAAVAVYANCGACGPDAKAGAKTEAQGAVCTGCAQAVKGQLCGHCTAQKLGLSEAQAKEFGKVLDAYNNSVAAAQADLLAKAKSSLGEEKATKLAESLKAPPKK